MLRKWEDMPDFMKCDEVKVYYDILRRRKASLFIKRVIDVVLSFFMIVVLAIPMIIIALIVKLDSAGPVFYRQERITTCGKRFRIHKFRTMVANADKIGAAVTTSGDSRITKVGAKLRDYRLDELPQVIDVFCGNMSFVGVRPEVKKYVDCYKPEWRATLLLPAGITNLTSIYYKDEGRLLNGAVDVDKTYKEEILPGKMKWNLKGIKEFSVLNDINLMIMTILAVLGKQFKEIDLENR